MCLKRYEGNGELSRYPFAPCLAGSNGAAALQTPPSANAPGGRAACSLLKDDEIDNATRVKLSARVIVFDEPGSPHPRSKLSFHLH